VELLAEKHPGTSTLDVLPANDSEVGFWTRVLGSRGVRRLLWTNEEAVEFVRLSAVRLRGGWGRMYLHAWVPAGVGRSARSEARSEVELGTELAPAVIHWSATLPPTLAAWDGWSAPPNAPLFKF